MEDPGYFGASIAFERAGASLIPVPVDNEGLSVCAGIRICAEARGAFFDPSSSIPARDDDVTGATAGGFEVGQKDGCIHNYS